MPSLFKHGSAAHSHGFAFRSLYLNPMNDLKFYEDYSGELNLHLCASSDYQIKEDEKLNEDGKTNKNGGGFYDRKRGGLFQSSCSSYYLQADENKNRNWNIGINSIPCVSKCIWDDSAVVTSTAPASSWSTLPRRSLLHRPLPTDIGNCSCYIRKEQSEGGGSFYSLYTHEGQGRVDRKLAVAHHRRKWGRSEFVITTNSTGLRSRWDDSYIGTVTANIMGSCYHIWDQGSLEDSLWRKSKQLVAIVMFLPTITTLTGGFRRIHAFIPKSQALHTRHLFQMEHSTEMPSDWEENVNKVNQLSSRVPHFNRVSKQYELDFRERKRSDVCIEPSVKNFQLVMKDDGAKQSSLLFGKMSRSKYLMEYRYPLTGYQAFAICLASIDSKLCCSI